MKRKLIGILLFLFAAFFSSCGDPTAPEDLLEEELYINVFTELLVINQLNEEKLDGVSRDYLREQVYEEYDVTREQFDRTHQYYQKQPDKQLDRLDKIEETLIDHRDNFQDRLNEDRKRLTDSVSTSVPDTLPKLNPNDYYNNDD